MPRCQRLQAMGLLPGPGHAVERLLRCQAAAHAGDECISHRHGAPPGAAGPLR